MFPKKGNKLHGRRQATQAGLHFNRAIADALRRDLGPTHQAAKTIMRWTGTSERTAKHWLSGSHGPSGLHLVQLVRHSDEVLRTILLLSGRSASWSADGAAELRSHLLAALKCLEQGE